jgi:hypothetical protein
MDFYGCRNAILFAWQNVPSRYLPLYFLATTFNCLRWTFHPQRLAVRVAGIMAGYRDAFTSKRAPVDLSVYRLWRKLKKGGAVRLESIIP